MKKSLALAALLGVLLRAGAYAADVDAVNDLTIDESSIVIEALDEKADDAAAVAGGLSLDAITGGVGQIVDTIGEVVNLADKIWEIIDKNRPVVTTTVKYANAIPKDIAHWTQLQSWSKPATKKYSFALKNKSGDKALSITYQVHWTYGGNFNGKGKFLTGVTVEPLMINVPWGYKVDLTAEVPDSTVANVGTQEDPIASMQVQLRWKVSSTFSSVDKKVIYYVQGDGLMEELGTPFTKGMEVKSDRQIAEIREQLGNVKF